MTVIGIDVGGTKTLVGLFDDAGGVLAREEFPTRDGGDDLERIATMVARAVADWQQHDATSNDASSAKVRAIAAGFPEYVSPAGILTSHEVLTWSEQPLGLLRDSLAPLGLGDVPIVIESDVRLGAWGEAAYGVGSSIPDFVYISLGTGLSSTVIIDGMPWTGARGEAIGLGEWRPLVDIDGPLASEGHHGNLEAYASGAGISSRYERLSGRAVTGRELVALAEADDVLARAILESAGAAIGRACADLVNVFDPSAVVLGGGLGTAATPLHDSILCSYEGYGDRRPGRPPMVVARNGPNAGVLGAAAAAVAISSSEDASLTRK